MRISDCSSDVCSSDLLSRIRSPLRRALPHFYHRSLAWLLRVKVRKIGEPSAAAPTLFVCNHISWLDIVVLSAALPASFIAKQEVNDWPFFGLLARLPRTVFGARGRRPRHVWHSDHGPNLERGRVRERVCY